MEEERRITLDQLSKELADVQRAKDQLLQEQKRLTSQFFEERRAISTERAELTSTQREMLTQDRFRDVNYVEV